MTEKPTKFTVFQGCKRDLGVRDRDETETFDFQSETRSRPRPSYTLPRPRRDRDLQVLGPRRDRDRDVERPRPRRFFETLALWVTLSPLLFLLMELFYIALTFYILDMTSIITLI